MTTLLLFFLLWHWSPPTTGSAVVLYTVDVRDAWGQRIMLASTPDTSWTPPAWLDHVVHRVSIRGFDDAARISPASEWSAPHVPVVERERWAEMGRSVRFAPLSMSVAGVQATLSAWPDSLR